MSKPRLLLKFLSGMNLFLLLVQIFCLCIPPFHLHEPIFVWLQIGYCVHDAVRPIPPVEAWERPWRIAWWVIREAIFWPPKLIRFFRGEIQ